MFSTCFHMKKHPIGKFVMDCRFELGSGLDLHDELFRRGMFSRKDGTEKPDADRGAVKFMGCAECGEVFPFDGRAVADPNLLYMVRPFGRLPEFRNGTGCAHGDAGFVAETGGPSGESGLTAAAWLFYRCLGCGDIIAVQARLSGDNGGQAVWSTRWFLFGEGSLPELMEVLRGSSMLAIRARGGGRPVSLVVTDDGTVMRENRATGRLEPDGRVVRDGTVMGQVAGNGVIRSRGEIVGSVEAGGTVRKMGTVIGAIESSGIIRKRGAVWGYAANCRGDFKSRRAIAAALVFFAEDYF